MPAERRTSPVAFMVAVILGIITEVVLDLARAILRGVSRGIYNGDLYFPQDFPAIGALTFLVAFVLVLFFIAVKLGDATKWIEDNLSPLGAMIAFFLVFASSAIVILPLFHFDRDFSPDATSQQPPPAAGASHSH